MKSIYFIFILVFILASCDGGLTKWKDGPYEVVYGFNGDSNYNLNYRINGSCFLGRVGNIEAVYSNSIYVFTRKKIKKMYSYSIIKKEKDNKFLNSAEIVMGPYTKVDFDSILNFNNMDTGLHWKKFKD